MGSSPCRSRLYRSALPAVTLLGALLLAPQLWTQVARKSQVSKGPRAVALLQLPPSGNARLIPVAIMVDGKFYDAGSYKANPVPMALDSGVVYEAFRSGISQGTFTITQPGKLDRTWIAQGTWLPAGAKPPQMHKKAEIPNIEEKDEPPKLHRGDKTAPAASAPAAPTSPAPSKPAAPAVAVEEKPVEDPNRPVLRRGPQPTKSERESAPEIPAAPPEKTQGPKNPGTPLQLIPAISDAGGPDPRPYTFDLQPGEDATYKSKMLELATAEIRARNKNEQPARAQTSRKAPPSPKVAFDDVHLRIFDLSNSNEPVLVLTARIHPPAFNSENAGFPQEVMLIAKTNLEGEVRKLFFSQVDPLHLERAPRMELIDAVDADGDGRGELLFRRTTDAGSSYSIYRVTADQLWPLYDGTP